MSDEKTYSPIEVAEAILEKVKEVYEKSSYKQTLEKAEKGKTLNPEDNKAEENKEANKKQKDGEKLYEEKAEKGQGLKIKKAEKLESFIKTRAEKKNKKMEKFMGTASATPTPAPTSTPSIAQQINWPGAVKKSEDKKEDLKKAAIWERKAHKDDKAIDSEQKGVHRPARPAASGEIFSAKKKGSGFSHAGLESRKTPNFKNKESIKDTHKKVLSEMKAMPKPNLPKSEEGAAPSAQPKMTSAPKQPKMSAGSAAPKEPKMPSADGGQAGQQVKQAKQSYKIPKPPKTNEGY
jgi:hypothetical protein